MQWFNEPAAWRVEGGRLHVTTGERTDFWRVTHYGFVRDSGHFYHETRRGDFTAEVRVRGDYRALYDQAGLMVRSDAENWIKAGIEHVHGRSLLSVVVTRGMSDWSVVPLARSLSAADWIEMRLTRRGTAVEVAYRMDGAAWTMARLAGFVDAAEVEVGMMCCSPERAGFDAEFDGWCVGEAAGTAGA